MFDKDKLSAVIALTMGLSVLPPGTASADNDDGKEDGSYVLTGNGAQLVADRTTEFHGSPATSRLNLAMAGNRWVVFNKVMQACNERRAAREKDVDLTAIGNQSRTIFIELLPPGQERNQIKSGCMVLGNEDDRNFLPTSIQVGFDIFTSTNFNLATNPACYYSGHASVPDGTLRFSEFAVLNKSNTHETRVHHVETPGRILSVDSDVGAV